jgi:hypothetical protein
VGKESHRVGSKRGQVEVLLFQPYKRKVLKLTLSSSVNSGPQETQEYPHAWKVMSLGLPAVSMISNLGPQILRSMPL